MTATDQSINWSQWAVTALPFLLGGVAAIFRYARTTMRRVTSYEREHRLLMEDLKRRSERLETVTPQIVKPLAESPELVQAKVNGA